MEKSVMREIHQINILFLTHYSKMYGANISMISLIKDLRERYKIRPFVICPMKGELGRELRKEKIPYEVVEFRQWVVSNNLNTIKYRLNYIKTNLFALIRIKSIIKEQFKEIDLVYSVTSVFDLGLWYAKLNGIPHIWHIREDIQHYDMVGIWNKKVMMRIYAKSDKLIFISKFLKDNFYESYGKMKNSVVIYNGIREMELNHRSTTDVVTFCIVGLIHKNKNQLQVIRACRQLKQDVDKEFLVYIVGDGDQAETKKLKEYVRRNHLEKHVKFCGYQKNVLPILEKCDVGIMASYREAFGRATVEYMMAGLPVIASKSGANEEIVKHKVTGLLYETNSIQGLKECMKYAITNPGAMKRMGEQGHLRAVDKFNMSRNTDEILGEIDKLTRCAISH